MEFINNPRLIIDLALNVTGAAICLFFFGAACVSIFINSQLDPLDGYDINLFIFEMTGHFPNTTLFM